MPRSRRDQEADEEARLACARWESFYMRDGRRIGVPKPDYIRSFDFDDPTYELLQDASKSRAGFTYALLYIPHLQEQIRVYEEMTPNKTHP